MHDQRNIFTTVLTPQIVTLRAKEEMKKLLDLFFYKTPYMVTRFLPVIISTR